MTEIRTASELDALPPRTILRGVGGRPWYRGVGSWVGVDGDLIEPHEDAPLTVLFRPDAPQPATGHHYCANCEGIDPASCINAEPSTGDAVERAARAIWEQEWQHSGMHDWDAQPDDVKAPFRADARATLAAQRNREALIGLLQSADRVGNYGDMADYILDHRNEFTAALAAARAGEAEEVLVGGDWIPRGNLARVLANTMRSRDEYAREAKELGIALAEMQPAQRAGEAVDRREVQRRIDLTLKNVARFADRAGKTPGERESIIAALTEAQADVALLAARGEAAPTEVEWGVRWSDGRVEACGAPGTPDDYEDSSVSAHGGARVQRTVSAWREVS